MDAGPAKPLSVVEWERKTARSLLQQGELSLTVPAGETELGREKSLIPLRPRQAPSCQTNAGVYKYPCRQAPCSGGAIPVLPHDPQGSSSTWEKAQPASQTHHAPCAQPGLCPALQGHNPPHSRGHTCGQWPARPGKPRRDVGGTGVTAPSPLSLLLAGRNVPTSASSLQPKCSQQTLHGILLGTKKLKKKTAGWDVLMP